MKKIFVLALFVFSAACNSSKSDKAESSNPSGQEQTAKVDTTPYSECDRGTPTSRIQGVWAQSFEQNGFNFEFYLDFSDDSVRVTNVCNYKGHTLTASVDSAANFSYHSVSVLETSQDEQHIEEAGFKMNCNVNIQPMRFQYTFKGSCLVLTKEKSNETLTFIRAR
jgi:hypothetical protein